MQKMQIMENMQNMQNIQQSTPGSLVPFAMFSTLYQPAFPEQLDIFCYGWDKLQTHIEDVNLLTNGMH